VTAARESGPAPGGGTRVTIVMYHYVRPLEGSRYPRLRALPLAAFRGQLDYIARHHEVIGAPELIAAVRGGPALPPNALLLTFDDGYTDHATHVLPELERRGWTGAFFPVAGAVTRRQMLDVNKLHFALAAENLCEFRIRSLVVWLDYAVLRPASLELFGRAHERRCRLLHHVVRTEAQPERKGSP